MAETELKIVMTITGRKATVGVQQTDTDPVLEVFEAASLTDLLEEVPGVLQAARAQWAKAPLFPKYSPGREATTPVEDGPEIEASKGVSDDALDLFEEGRSDADSGGCLDLFEDEQGESDTGDTLDLFDDGPGVDTDEGSGSSDLFNEEPDGPEGGEGLDLFEDVSRDSEESGDRLELF